MSNSAGSLPPETPEAGFLPFLKELYRIWITERPVQIAAALAYYAIFSCVPVVYISFTLVDRIFQRLPIEEQVYARITELFGAEMAQSLQEAVAGLAERTSSGSALLSIIGFLALAFTASLIFFQLQHALNTIWHVPPPKREQTRAYVTNRLLAFVMVLGVVVLLVVAAVVNLLVSIVDSWIDLGLAVAVGNTVAFAALVALSFALIFKFLPNARVAWRDVWLGAGVAALLVTAGIYLLSLYLGAGRFSSALEAAGTVAVLLTAFYFFGQIFVIGALFVRVYAAMFGSGIVPRGEQPSPESAPPAEPSAGDDDGGRSTGNGEELEAA